MASLLTTLWDGMDRVSIKKCILDVFEIDERNVTIESEIMAGYIHFISCLYVFPVVPGQLSDAGYDKTSSIEATALACGIGCILSSYITNLPFVIAPPTSVSIYLAVSLQQMNLNRIQGDSVVMLSGCALLCVGIFKPVTALVSRLIPDCIQASTAVGIGLITAVAGAIELDLVVPGKYTIVEMGPITPAIIIALLTTILIIYCSHVKKYKAAFFLGLVFGTLSWWWYANEWPDTIMRIPKLTVDRGVTVDFQLLGLLANLLFLYILTLNGLSRSMSDLALLTHPVEETIPRGHWLFIICGVATIISGFFSGPPILLSPETAAGIKAGARTGLSTLVCGILFLVTIFFCPLFSNVPPTGTSPLLLLVGLTLFTNTNRIKWTHAPDAVPAFFVLLLIPFTYSILSGVGVGYALYVGIALISGEGLWSHRYSLLPGAASAGSSSSSGNSSSNSNGGGGSSSAYNEFIEYCYSVQVAVQQWKGYVLRCVYAVTATVAAPGGGSSGSGSGAGTSSSMLSSGGVHESMWIRCSHAARETLLCFGMTVSCCCVSCVGGLAGYLLGDDEDNGDATKVHTNPLSLHHHTFAVHHGGRSGGDSGDSGGTAASTSTSTSISIPIGGIPSTVGDGFKGSHHQHHHHHHFAPRRDSDDFAEDDSPMMTPAVHTLHETRRDEAMASLLRDP